MIYTALLISLASLGFRVITGKGMIFYFLRKPFDEIGKTYKQLKGNKEGIEATIRDFTEDIIGINKKPDNWQDFNNRTKKEVLIDWRKKLKDAEAKLKRLKKYRLTPVIIYLMKPVILCSTCMASVHSIIWFPYLVGEYNKDIIIVALIAAILNTVIFTAFELMTEKINYLKNN